MTRKPPVSPVHPAALEAQEEIAQLRQALVRSQRETASWKARTDHLVSSVIEAARDAVLANPLQRVPAPKRDRRKVKDEHALMVLTDWQGAKVTPSYNTDIMNLRVHRFMDKALRITDIQRMDHPVRHATLAFDGDMVEGLWNFPTQPFEIDATIFGQFVSVSNLIVEVVRRALASFETVTVVAEWGNHGRMGSKRDAVPRSDNIDRMTYELARQVLMSSGEPRLNWKANGAEDIQRIEIGNYRALLMHGDEVGRQGFASPSAWQAAGNRWKAGGYTGPAWSSGAPSNDFHDIYLGHYHRHAQEPLSDGMSTIFWTGSTESENRYARDSMAASGVPSQRLHFIDPEAGRVSSIYQVWLDDEEKA
jgi:hypothetical protein